jgi:hypothetical protein
MCEKKWTYNGKMFSPNVTLCLDQQSFSLLFSKIGLLAGKIELKANIFALNSYSI